MVREDIVLLNVLLLYYCTHQRLMSNTFASLHTYAWQNNLHWGWKPVLTYGQHAFTESILCKRIIPVSLCIFRRHKSTLGELNSTTDTLRYVSELFAMYFVKCTPHWNFYNYHYRNSTNSMKQSPCSDANSHTASQEIPAFMETEGPNFYNYHYRNLTNSMKQNPCSDAS